MKICKYCNVEREDYFYYRQSSGPLYRKCKLCMGIKKEIVDDSSKLKQERTNETKTCKHCKVERQWHFFYTGGSKCKVCLGVKKILPNKPETIVINYNQPLNEKDIKEIYRFVWLVRARKYDVDVVDFWRIIHYYECLWPDWRTDKTEKVKDEITRKWKSLERWFLKNKEAYENQNN